MALLATAAFVLGTPHALHANPQDGVVSAGSATIASTGNKLDVH